MNENEPYYFTADGKCPPWFDENGLFDPKKFDATLPYNPKGTTYTLPSNPNRAFENPYDLRNLRIINPRRVTESLQALEDSNKLDQRPAICVVATGGTIASAMTKEGELVASVDIQTIFDYVGRFYKVRYDYAAFSFPTLIDSSQMKIDYDADIVSIK